MSHTPTPYYAYGSEQTTAVWVNSRVTNRRVCTVAPGPNDFGTAEFISRACNAHDELVAALARLLVGVTKQDAFDCEWYEGLDGDAIDEARAALAKVTP